MAGLRIMAVLDRSGIHEIISDGDVPYVLPGVLPRARYDSARGSTS